MSAIRRAVVGPIVVATLAVAIALPLLLVNGGDGSYSCRGSAIVDLVHPEPQENASFRGNFFDSGWQCNRQAREQSAAAGGVLLVGFLVSSTWAMRRRRQLKRAV